MLVNKQWIKEEIKKEMKNSSDNENGNTIYQNLCDATKAVLRRKFTMINAYIMKKERSQINNLILHSRN